jgi:D-alanine--D-alanine ligase
MLVALTYNLARPSADGSEPPDRQAEYDSEETVDAIGQALESLGHRVLLIEADADAYERFRQARPAIVFNISEGLRGESRESHIPAMLEMLEIPYTGSGVLALGLSLEKAMAKRVWAYHGIATPAFRVIPPGAPAAADGLRFPLFVKPLAEGSSMGISPRSRVENAEQLDEQVRFIQEVYRQPALVEEYAGGREFTVGLVGNGRPHVLPVMEILLEKVPPSRGIYDYQYKAEWGDWDYYSCPAAIDGGLERRMAETAVAAWGALGCRDLGRVDIRLDSSGVPHVLEVNPLPGLKPGHSDLCRMAERAGWSYERLIGAVLGAAAQRYGL